MDDYSFEKGIKDLIEMMVNDIIELPDDSYQEEDKMFDITVFNNFLTSMGETGYMDKASMSPKRRVRKRPKVNAPAVSEIYNKVKITDDEIFKIGDFKDVGGGYVTFGVYPQSWRAENVTIEGYDEECGYYLGSDNCLYACKNFKVEPIKWKVLSRGSELFLVSDRILDVVGHCGERNYYVESPIREWLNGKFYDKAFSESQKNMIVTTLVDNSVASTGDYENPYIGENTNDKIFLLSYAEVDKYLKDYDDRCKTGTDYTDSGVNSWWLRSPEKSDWYDVLYIGDNGWVDSSDHMDYPYDHGTVPALKIKL